MSDKPKQKFMTAERKSRILTSALLAVGVPLLLFIVIPLELWCNNISELNYHISDILLYMILFFAFTVAGIFCMLFFVPEKVYRVFRGIVIGFGVMFFLQSNYLNVGINGLLGDDTQTVVQLVGIPMMIFNTALWILVVSGCIVASIFIKKQEIVRLIATLLATVLCFTQVIGIVVPLLSTDFSQETPSEKNELMQEEYESVGGAFLTNKNMTTLGRDRNVVMFVIDRMDEVLYTRKNLSMVQEYIDDFGGFTYFTDNIARYGHTYPALSYMLTKKDLATDEKRIDYFLDVYNENDTLSVLAENGYSVNMYTDSYHGYHEAQYLPDYISNVEKVSTSSIKNREENKWDLFKHNLVVVLARIAPLALKDVMPKTSSEQLSGFGNTTSEDLTAEQASTDMKKTYDTIHDGEFSIGGNKDFTMIHVSGCHNVMYNEKWEPTTGDERYDIRISLKNSLEIIAEYIKEMKALGVYDNATIIITGDHSAPISDAKPLDGIRLTSLFVKPSNEGAEVKMKTSSAQVSHENLWATIFKSEGIAYSETDFGKSVFDIDPTENQKRVYYWHMWGGSGIYTECEYTITGPGADYSNWELTAERVTKKALFA